MSESSNYIFWRMWSLGWSLRKEVRNSNEQAEKVAGAEMDKGEGNCSSQTGVS